MTTFIAMQTHMLTIIYIAYDICHSF